MFIYIDRIHHINTFFFEAKLGNCSGSGSISIKKPGNKIEKPAVLEIDLSYPTKEKSFKNIGI